MNVDYERESEPGKVWFTRAEYCIIYITLKISIYSCQQPDDDLLYWEGQAWLLEGFEKLTIAIGRSASGTFGTTKVYVRVCTYTRFRSRLEFS
jgi:hypothetical protein